MDRNNILSTILMLSGAFVCIAIGELIPPLRRLHDWTVVNKGACIAVFIVLFVLGLLTFIGTIIEMTGRLGRSLKEEEVEKMAADFRENQPGVVWRKWAYRFRGSGHGGSFQIESPIKELKVSVQTGQWRNDPVITRMLIISVGALTMAVGVLGLNFVLFEPGIKFLLLVAAAYAACMITQAWWKA